MRTAHARDARPLRELIDGVAAEPDVTLLVLPGQVDARTWRRRIADSAADPRSILLTALVDGELAGNLGLRPDPHPCSAHVAWVGMSVAAPWRGLGVGGALLEAAAGWAVANAVDKLALERLPAQRARGPLLRAPGLRARGPAARALPSRRGVP